MASLNQYASRVAHLVGQPDNHSLKERIKDMIKDYFAKYIVQSIDRNGIQPYYKLTLRVDMKPIESTKVINPNFNNDFYYIDGVRQYEADGVTPKENPRKYRYTHYESTTKIPKPINIKSDAPFTRVYIPYTSRQFKYGPETIFWISCSSCFTSLHAEYHYKDDIIRCARKTPPHLVNEEVIKEIAIDTIWENPEEIMGYYGATDNQDLDLPFPNEMFNFVLADLLKVEFPTVPRDTEIANK